MEEIGYEDVLESELDAQEYVYVPRPEELIHSHLQSSGKGSSKAKGLKKTLKEKVLKESHLKKSHKKSKDKTSPKEKVHKMKEGKKSTLKGKSILGIAMSSKRSKQTVGSQELEKKFDSYLQGAKKNLKTFQHSSDPSPKFALDNSEKSNYRAIPPATDDYSSRDQVRNQMRERATNAQEKYDILNERDSCLRSQDVKRIEPKRKVIQGTCPDMCPEKERYSRIAKNCLSVFEMKMGLDPMSNSKDVDHRYMVKEYSRSSADQQEPLPNELRPVSVLAFTMDYLICNIINRQDDHIPVADWYDFVWNRTRSIRKDITQQQLGDIASVDILEKCARFHILCAELLSEEDTATFDPKINNENLTKCLQTLKHMYYDLQTKGIQCPNEAEFRAYDILLSLTEGETLRLVKDLRKEVFKSSHVTTAFEAALAFKSNNYVKFFNLMEKSTYLSSCIMHRYMHEARVRAMHVIIRSFTVQNKPTLYPLSNLVRKLKFENTMEAAQFCSCHGLSVDETDVTLQKQVFQKTSSDYTVERSSFLVGKKLETGLGAIVNNGPLPENPLFWYEPVNSFDENGVLIDPSYAIDEEDMIEDQSAEKMDLMSSSNIPTINAPKAQEFHSSSTAPSISKKSDVFKSKIPEAPFESVPNTIPQNTFYSPRVTESENTFKNQSSFVFSGQTENSTQSTTIATTSTTTSKFFVKDPSPVFKQNTIVPKLSFLEASQAEEICRSPFSVQATTSPPVSKTQSPSVALKSFKWPGEILANQSDQSALFLPPTLPAVVIETPKEDEGDLLRIQNVENDSNYFLQSDIKEDLFDIDDDDTMIIESEAIVDSLGCDIELPDADYSDILMLEEKESTMDAYDKEDEETLRKIRDEKISELILNIEDEVYSNCLEKLTIAICKETVAEEWKKKIERDDHIEKMKTYLGRKVLYKWRLFCERKRQRNTYMQSEPLSPWIPMLINTEYVSSGASSPFTVYKKHCSLSRLEDTKMKERAMKPGWEPLVAENFSSVHKQQNLPSAYLRKTGLNQFLKIGVVFPTLMDENIEVFKTWMCRKLKLSVVADNQTQKTKHMSFFSLKGGKAIVCFLAEIHELEKSGYDDFMKGISGVIFCCPTNFPDSTVFRSLLDQLNKVLNHPNLLSPFPLCFFFLPSSQKFSVVNQLVSFFDETLHSGRNLSAIKMSRLSGISMSEKNSKEVISGMKWLIENLEPLPELSCCRIPNFIEDSFISTFNSVLWKLTLPEFKLLYKMPQHTINFYNKMLKSRANLLCSPLLMKTVMCWPPPELKFLQSDYSFIDTSLQKEVCDFITNLCLPDFNGDPHDKQDMWTYVRDITLSDDPDSEMLFISIESVLQNSSNMIDWPSIISKCAHYLICHHNSKIASHLESDVYYLREDSEAVDFKAFWQAVLLSLNEQNTNSKKRKSFEFKVESVEKKRKDDDLMLEESYNPDQTEIRNLLLVPDVADVTNNRVQDMLKSLQAALQKQSEEEDGFIQKLNESIAGESLFDENNPLEERLVSPEREVPHIQCDVQPKNKRCAISSSSISLKSMDSTQEEDTSSSNLWRKLIGKDLPSGISSPSSISEKLAELRYNIQKNNILEDNFGLLLDL